jgi:carbamoyltransferase
MQAKIRAGEPVYLLGVGVAGHNAGIALVEVSLQRGVRLICNNEEERYTGIKFDPNYPEQSISALLTQMARIGIPTTEIHACLASWNYPRLASTLLASVLQELPGSVVFLNPANFPPLNIKHIWQAHEAPARLGTQLGLDRPLPIIGMRHHCNHAYFSYAVSPFARSHDPVMVTVLDGTGDEGAISLYVASGGRLKLIRSNQSIFDSLGLFYGMISSTQGGWHMLSSEGRYMGAAAWGNSSRLTNPYYRRLRQLFYFGGDGNVYLNRSMANWPRKLQLKPYTEALSEILGPAICLNNVWNPDAVLKIEDIEHAQITQERVDKAAATQLLFEDLLFHTVDHLIRSTGSNKLVLTGGTALNSVANMRLLEHFGEAYYERYLNRKSARLHLWIPPTPGDAGACVGAAYHFALANDVPLGEPLRHAFYCGLAPTNAEIREALETNADIAYLRLGEFADAGRQELIADLMAYIVSRDGVVGVFHGVAETGPRALGHRSIVANPRNPKTREVLNQLVKYREAIRPLAPMATPEAAHLWFELEPGASDSNYNAYNYMVLTARARQESYSVIPAVIHKDGTGRIQIVREDVDPLIYSFLKALGRRNGAEVSVNTSLNIGGPIIQTPTQAIGTLKRSKGMDGLFMVGAEGCAFVVWHTALTRPKDSGKRLLKWIEAWQEEVGVLFS